MRPRNRNLEREIAAAEATMREKTTVHAAVTRLLRMYSRNDVVWKSSTYPCTLNAEGSLLMPLAISSSPGVSEVNSITRYGPSVAISHPTMTT